MARSLFAAGGRLATCSTTPTAMACSRVASVPTTAARSWGAFVPFGGGQTERQIQLITDFEPRLITVTPSYCLNLIEEMERLGIDPAATSLRVGVFEAEP